MKTLVTWTGKSGQKYEFETYPVGTQFYKVSGVYIACKRLISGSYEALYVGEAQSLYDRLNAGAAHHDGLKCAARRSMTDIGAFVVSGDPQRMRVETDLRHSLNPPCNRQSVPENTNTLFR